MVLVQLRAQRRNRMMEQDMVRQQKERMEAE